MSPQTTLDSLSPGDLGTWVLERAGGGEHLFGPALKTGRHTALGLRLPRVYRDKPAAASSHRLDQCGWGILWTTRSKKRLEPLLKPLIDLRKSQAGDLYKEFVMDEGEESIAKFLAKHNESLGVVEPKRVPYYLLIVGNPVEISFEVQYYLSLNHAVGRLDFADDEHCADYVHHLANTGDSEAMTEQRVGVFCVENDATTQLFAQRLMEPLVEKLTDCREDWEFSNYRGKEATRDGLERLLSRERPSLLLVSSHGTRLAPDSPAQKANQGAIVCEKTEAQSQAQAHVFGATHVPRKNALLGQVCLLFSCYATGTPRLGSYPFQPGPWRKTGTDRGILAAQPFTAALPQALMANGALAIIGHVDRSWSLSFYWRERSRSRSGELDSINVDSRSALEESMWQLLAGEPVGHALRPLNKRYAYLSGRLANRLHKFHGRYINKRTVSNLALSEIGYLWTGINDARNLVLLGDPATYLRGRRDSHTAPVQLPLHLLSMAQEEARKRKMTTDQWIESVIQTRLGAKTRRRRG